MVADDLEDTKLEDVMKKDKILEVGLIVKLSLNLVVGLTTLGTFKLKGTVEE